MNYTLMKIKEGDPGIDQTIEQMENLVDAGVKDPLIRNTALEIIASMPARDSSAEIEAIFFWVKQNIRFTKDPYQIELISNPLRTLELKAGDCDDLAILLSSLLRSIGYNTRFKVVSAKASGKLHHVYTQAYFSGTWISLDPTEEYSSVGKEPLGITREKIYGGNMRNLGMFENPFEENYFDKAWVPKIDPSEMEIYIPEDVAPIAEQKMLIREYIKDTVIQAIGKGELDTDGIQEGISYLQSGRVQLQSHIRDAIIEALQTCKKLYPDISSQVSGLGIGFTVLFPIIIGAVATLAGAYATVRAAGQGQVYYTPPTTYTAPGFNVTTTPKVDWSAFLSSPIGLVMIGVGAIALVAILRRR